MSIEVILTQDDAKLGRSGQIVKVSPGFAQNFLFPLKKAIPATKGNLHNATLQKEALEKEKAEKLEQARQVAQSLSKVSITISADAGEQDKLFGAVTAADIHQALLAQSVQIDKKCLHLEEPIKKIGSHSVNVRLHPEVHTKIKVWVVKKINA